MKLEEWEESAFHSPSFQTLGSVCQTTSVMMSIRKERASGGWQMDDICDCLVLPHLAFLFPVWPFPLEAQRGHISATHAGPLIASPSTVPAEGEGKRAHSVESRLTKDCFFFSFYLHPKNQDQSHFTNN